MRSTADQYRIIAAGAGWIAREDRGRLRIEGRDAQRWLQGLVTNDVLALVRGESNYAAWLTPQGRMIADLGIHHRGDYFLVDVPTADAAGLAARLDQMIFAEAVTVADVSSSTAQFTVLGKDAHSVVERIGMDDGSVVGLFGEFPAFDVFTDASRRDAMTLGFERAGAVALSAEFFEAFRIELGRPEFGVDMTGETIPLEAGLLDRAISTTKGCYVGQEIIIRVLHRGGGRVAKRLVKLQFDAAAGVPEAGAAIARDGHEVGRITSAAISPTTGRPIALGYVQRDHAEVGVKLDAAGRAAEIVGFAG